jgi:Domain of unknown function (DUF6249)
MAGIGPYLVGVAFWIFVGVVAVAGIVADYKRRRGNIDVIRMAIDKGQQLDPALIEKLTSGGERDQPIDPVQMKFAAIITIASGIGVCLLALFLTGISALAFYPTFGLGLVTICVGIGLRVASKMLAETRQHEPPRNGAPREDLPRNELP